MIKFIRNLNFGYFLFGASLIVGLTAYQQLQQLYDMPDASHQDWIKVIVMLIAAVYLCVAASIKIYKGKKPRRRTEI